MRKSTTFWSSLCNWIDQSIEAIKVFLMEESEELRITWGMLAPTSNVTMEMLLPSWDPPWKQLNLGEISALF
jgi:hypothetical protein